MSTLENTDVNQRKRECLLEELASTLVSAGCKIIAAKGLSGYRLPPYLANDGYGDQQSKMPDLLAFDPAENQFILGVVRASRDELEAESSLTEYDVFFDQKDKNGKSYRVVIIAPPDCASEVASVVTHYIHRELWHLLTIVAAKTAEVN